MKKITSLLLIIFPLVLSIFLIFPIDLFCDYSRPVSLLQIFQVNTLPPTPPIYQPSPLVEEGKSDIIIWLDNSQDVREISSMLYMKNFLKTFIFMLSQDNSVVTLYPFESVNSFKKSKSIIQDKTYFTKRTIEIFKKSLSKNKIAILFYGNGISSNEIKQSLNKFSKNNIRFYAVSFGKPQDKQELENLFKQVNGGFEVLNTYKNIDKIFLSLFEQIKSPEIIKWQDNAFTLDQDIKKIMIVFDNFKNRNIILKDPNCKKYSKKRHENLFWQRLNSFEIILISRPVSGRWEIKGFQGSDNDKIFIPSQIKLEATINKTVIYNGDKIVISAWISKNNRPIDSQGKVFAHIINNNIEMGRVELTKDLDSNGIYNGWFIFNIFNLNNEYLIKIIFLDKYFVKHKDIYFKVIQPADSQDYTNLQHPQKPLRQNNYKEVFYKFGFLNLILLVLCLTIYLIKRICGKRKSKNKSG